MHSLLPRRGIPSLGIKSVRIWRSILDTLTQDTGHILIFSLWTFNPILRPPTIVYLHLRTPTCCQRSSAWSRRSTDQASKLLSSPPGLQTSNNQNQSNQTKSPPHHLHWWAHMCEVVELAAIKHPQVFTIPNVHHLPNAASQIPIPWIPERQPKNVKKIPT